VSAGDQERTEEATPKRREDARNDGQIPRSQELTMAMVLLGSALLINMAGPMLAGRMLSVFGFGLASIASAPLDANGSISLLRELGWQALGTIAIWGCSLAGIALFIAGVQGRGVFTTKPLEPKLDRLNPGTNAKRIGGMQSWAELVKSLFKLLIVTVAVRGAIIAAWPDTMSLTQKGPTSFLHVVRQYSVKLLMTAGLCYLGLALFDYIYQVWQHERQMRMSREEIKQEMRQSEGDPHVKQRMRAMGRAFARRQMFRDVPKADVVITNPTHYAVALRYDPLVAPAPIVIAMGQRKVAERIKQIAKESGVPMIENKPIARALVAKARVGSMIPSELYLAVAEILAFVIRRRILRGGRGLREVLA
jgi:flagellar biosynthesis protein FlhB